MSDVAIKSLKGNGKSKQIISVGGVPGLKIQVSATGSKSWIFRTKVIGKVKDIGLGSYPTVGLKQARELAAEVKLTVIQGHDPVEAKKLARAEAAAKQASMVTFEVVAESYIQSIEAGWKNHKTAAQWRSSLQSYAYPLIGKLPISSVETSNVISVLDPIWVTKTETASRVRMRMENILAYATTRGYRTGENPARWDSHLETLFPSPEKLKGNNHHAALPYVMAPEFCKTLCSMDTASAFALQLVILTATRSSEVRSSTWNEYDLNNKLWTIDASRMKAGKQHVVPLSSQSICVLQRIKQTHLDNGTYSPNGYLFPNQRSLTRPISDVAISKIIKKINVQHQIHGKPELIDPHMGNKIVTVHGFRSTFRDWAGEVSPHSREVIEHALAHQLKDKSEQAYQRGSLLEKRRALMNDWAKFLKG